MSAGHVLIGSDGDVIGMDAAFCSMMQADSDAIRGRLVLDVTAPADRAECAAAIQQLRDTHRPFVITKRFIRDDGSIFWVRNTVSISVDGSAPPVVMATVEPVETTAPDHDPAALLDVAKFLIATRRDRTSVCDRMIFSEPGWDAVLAAYVAEAEGRTLDVAALSESLGHAPSVVTRWVRALVHHDVLELELGKPDAHAPKSFRLTAATHRKLEDYLARANPFGDRMIVDRAA